jgi:hypothetical protein
MAKVESTHCTKAPVLPQSTKNILTSANNVPPTHAYLPSVNTATMPPTTTTLAFPATLTSLCSAGLQVPFLVVNLSPYEVSVDMTLDENCIKHDFNPVGLNHYYSSWESNSLGNFDLDYAPYNAYLQ